MELMDKAMTACENFLMCKGYDIVGTFDDVIVVDTGEGIAVVKVVIVEDGFQDSISRSEAEGLMVKALVKFGITNVPVRFDDVQLLIVEGSRALMRYHTNVLGDSYDD